MVKTKKTAGKHSGPVRAVRPKSSRPSKPSSYWGKVENSWRGLADHYGFRRITPSDAHKPEKEKKSAKDAKSSHTEEDVIVLVSRMYAQNPSVRSNSSHKVWHFSTSKDFPTTASLHIIGGGTDPLFDAQIIIAFHRYLAHAKLKNAVLKINSMGCRVCRPLYKKQLQAFIRGKESSFCAECQVAIKTNPIAIFECKKAQCKEICEHAPNFLDKICAGCTQHLKAVLEYLDETGIPYALDNRLIHSTDYHNKTIFEFSLESEKGAPKILVQGGRHDYLMENVGGRPTPAVSGVAHMDVLRDVAKGMDSLTLPKSVRRVFVAHAGPLAKKKALGLIETLYAANISAHEALSRESLGAQLKVASRDGSEIALILGQREVYEGSIIVRDLKTGLQETFPLHRMVDEVKKRFLSHHA